VEASWRAIRHPRRRHRPGVPPSRERARAVMLRLPRKSDGEFLDAQRLPAGRRREDVEVARQFRDDKRATDHEQIRRAEMGWPSPSFSDVGYPLSATPKLDS